MSDIKSVFWTVLFRMASRVFVFFTPSDSSLVRNWFVFTEPRTPVVKLIWEAFQLLFFRWLRWFMKPRWELYLSFFSCSFLSAQSSFVSMALVYFKNTHNFFSLSKARPSGLRAINVSMLYHRNLWRRRYGIFRCLFEVWPYFGPLLLGGSHAVPCIPRSCTTEGKCHRGSEALFSSVEDFRIENISSLHMPWCMAIRGSCRTGQ